MTGGDRSAPPQLEDGGVHGIAELRDAALFLPRRGNGAGDALLVEPFLDLGHQGVAAGMPGGRQSAEVDQTERDGENRLGRGAAGSLSRCVGTYIANRIVIFVVFQKTYSLILPNLRWQGDHSFDPVAISRHARL